MISMRSMSSMSTRPSKPTYDENVVVVRGMTVDQNQNAISVIARAGKSADADRVVARVVREIHAAHAAHRFGDGRVVHRAELLLRDDRDARGRVVDRLCVTRSRGDFFERRQREIELHLPGFRDFDRLFDRDEIRRA